MIDDKVRTTINSAPELAQARRSLKAYLERGESTVPDEIRARLTEIKRQAVTNNDQVLAKSVWCLETVADAQDDYIHTYRLMKIGSYYDGWCELEKVERDLDILDPHFKDIDGDYFLENIRKHVHQFQSMYPYKLFLSTELLHRKMSCNICEQHILLWNKCSHIPGSPDELVNRERMLVGYEGHSGTFTIGAGVSGHGEASFSYPSAAG